MILDLMIGGASVEEMLTFGVRLIRMLCVAKAIPSSTGRSTRQMNGPMTPLA
ncbi:MULTISPECIES: hypothetical protein [Bradyrhizobium]|uniref:hypothetical protein n=1 Tax=Bradyrhizobium centrosematis TaxID=1300039 RepID=UPI00216A83F8|nr:hypothetical protein [Bradyrhizobium centrosematis]MCS3765877.1 hypothetical protein [Bradyrhizobium centrosematis]MCS3778221.1 hypothetical protein [Bradyrhizobium centrosematis]